jgi:hypothetical protein
VVSSVSSSIEFVSDSSILVAQLTLTDAQFRVGGTYTLIPGQAGVIIVPVNGAWHTYVTTGGGSNVTGTIRHQASGGSPITIISATFWTAGGGVPVLRFGEQQANTMNIQSTVDIRGLGVEVNIGAGAGAAHVSSYGFIIVVSYMVYTYPVT